MEPVCKIVGGVAGDGQHGAALPLQQPGIRQQPLVYRLGLAGEDGLGAVGHSRVAPDQGGQVLLVPTGVGLVQNALVKDLGGLRSHAAEDAEARLLCSHTIPFAVSSVSDNTA